MKLSTEIKNLFDLMVDDLTLLVSLHDKELTEEMLTLLRDNNFPYTLGFALQNKEASEIFDLLKSGMDDLKADNMDELAADYADIYLTNTLSASPFESVWLDEESLVMQAPMFEVRKCYEKFSLEIDNWQVRSDDHFIHQLQFAAHLLSMKDEENLEYLSVFMDEHLFRWFDQFAAKVANRCATKFYAGLVMLTSNYVNELRNILAIITEQKRPSKDEIEAKFTGVIPLETMPLQYNPGSAESW